jgi:fumarate hydratase class II
LLQATIRERASSRGRSDPGSLRAGHPLFHEETTAVTSTRMESDSMGEMAVPAEAYYGAQTGRAARNFQLSDLRFPREFIRALGLVKKSAAQVNRELGLLPGELAGPIVEAAQAVADGHHDDQFVLDVFQTGSGTSTNMNANEVIAGLANERLTGKRGGRAPVHPNDAVNMGQSSNDVIPTAIHVSAMEGMHHRLVPALRQLRDVLSERATAFDPVVKIGRTHLQDAVPIRLGQEFAGYATQVDHAVGRVERTFATLCELPIGGTALGTGINTHAEFRERMATHLSRETGLPLRPAACGFEAMAQRDAAVEASGALRTVAVSLSCIANNLRFLGSGPRCGIGEIRIPELQPGSSIMPGKVNPVIPEAVMMVAAQVVGNDATIAWANALGSNFDLNVMMPVIAFNLLQSIGLLSAAAEHLALKCVDAREFLAGQKTEGVRRLEADAARCGEHVEKSLAMCTALAPRIGYDVASAMAKTAYREGRTIRALALDLTGQPAAQVVSRLGAPQLAETLDRHGGYPSSDEIEKLLEPYGQTIRGTGVHGGATG